MTLTLMPFLWVLTFALFSVACQSQTVDSKNSNLMDKTTDDVFQNDSVLQFTEVWVWKYRNEHIAEGESGHEGEMAVYYHPSLKYWLFTSEAFGSYDMIEWVIAQPGGVYVMATRDEFGNLELFSDTLNISPGSPVDTLFAKGEEVKTFGDPSLGFPIIKGEAYAENYLKTNVISQYYIGHVDVDIRPVYYFNQLDWEVKLPVAFPSDMPPGKIILSEQSLVSNKTISMEFKYISHADYQISIQ